MSNAAWIILIGSLVGISSSLVGVFLVIKRLSMLGDAISHTVLFGIVVAFLVTGSRAPFIMLIGATAVGLLTAYLTSTLNRIGRLQEDASIGVTFTWLFAVGVILISAYAGQVDLDQDCVLYGEIALAPFDTVTLFNREIGPRSFWILLCVTVSVLLFVLIGYPKLKTISFDPGLAASLGINIALWHYLLMGFVSLTTVAAFESVGAILVVALLVVPANAAYLVASSLSGMILGSCLISVLSSFLGYYLAVYYDASVSAGIALTSGIIFFLLLVYSACVCYIPNPTEK